MTNQPSKRKSFIIHKDSLSVLKKLNDVQAGKLFKSIAAYQEHNLLPEDNLISIVFEPFLNQFIRDEENYRNTCERRREAGSKGGKQKVANASKSKQKLANLADSKSKSKSDSKIILKEQFEKIYRTYNQDKKIKVIPFDKLKTKFKSCLQVVSFDELEQGVKDYLAYLSNETWRKKKSFDSWINSSEYYANDWKSEIVGSVNKSHDSLAAKLNSIAGDDYFKSVVVGDVVTITCNDGMKTKAYDLPDAVKNEIKAQFEQSIKII